MKNLTNRQVISSGLAITVGLVLADLLMQKPIDGLSITVSGIIVIGILFLVKLIFGKSKP
jgi:hypothetical protein